MVVYYKHQHHPNTPNTQMFISAVATIRPLLPTIQTQSHHHPQPTFGGQMTPLSPLKILIKEKYLNFNASDRNFVEAYLMAVDARPHQALLFTVYTQHGAIYSNLPLEALLLFIPEIGDPYEYTNEQLQPYSCLEGPVSTITYDLLKNANLIAKINGEQVNAVYLFTISYSGGGLASDPEQFKTHNIIALYNGQLAALPNNHCLFRDNWFAYTPKQWPNYTRQTTSFKPGG